MMTKEEYEAKRQARYDRLIAAAEKAERESAANWNQAHDMASVIPFGQPILIGHYSESRDRNYRNRIENKHRRGYELHQKALEYSSRADSIQNNDAIFSDDPEATEKLSDKLAKLEALQAWYKAVNVAYKKYLKDPASLDKSELDDKAKVLIRNFKQEYSWEPNPIPGYRLTNNNANIRRLKERAAIVEKKQAMDDSEVVTSKGTRIEYAPGENRIRIHFTGRVDIDTFKSLKQHGFRVAKSQGEFTFSGYYNFNCKMFAKNLIEKESEK